jgi:hypothetical protein
LNSLRIFPQAHFEDDLALVRLEDDLRLASIAQSPPRGATEIAKAGENVPAFARLEMVSQMSRYPKVPLIAIAFSIGAALSLSQHVSRAQDADKPAIAPQPRTINLTQEQRFIIKENVKDLGTAKAPKDAPETIGDPVPTNIVLHALPSEVGVKVSQVRSHMFFIKDDNNVIVLVSPTDRRIADVIR